MNKVTITNFRTEQQAACFALWLKRNLEEGKCNLVGTEGAYVPEWDGIDTNTSTKDNIVINLHVAEYDF